MPTPGDLKREIERLQSDLQQACQEKIQAAEYGLAVLEEKQEVQDKLEDIENKYETAKQEMKQSQEQLELLRSKNDSLQSKNDDRQGSLLHESTTRESGLATKIADLQIHLKNAKKQERMSRKEIDHLKQHSETLHKENEKLSEVKEQMSHENRELKMKETRFNEEYNLLEEEYTHLQKNLSKLKQTLVEFEGLKVENKSFLDEVDSLQLQLQITRDARDQLEKQLHEALDTVKEQREHHTQQQKELYELKQQIITKKWENDRPVDIKYVNVQHDEEHPIVRQITEEYKTSQPAPSPGLVEDLMKELQFTEIRDLEDQLRTAHNEKKELEQRLHSQKAYSAEHIVAEASKLCRQNSSESSDLEEGDEYSINNQLKELSDLKESLKQSRNRESVYQMEIERMTIEIKGLNEKLTNFENDQTKNQQMIKTTTEEKKSFTDEILSLKSKLRDANSTIKSLKEDIKVLNEVSSEGLATLNITQDELARINNELMNMHGKMTGTSIIQNNAASKTSTDKSPSRGQRQECMKLVSQIKQNLQSLSAAYSSNRIQNNDDNLQNGKNEVFAENAHLKEQLLKMQNFLATKREQISTLRTVLKANKATYEVALANLKSRYENDKALQSEANTQLKQQIKMLKSECQTFTSLRSIFATRCEEYVEQLNDKQKSILEAEAEKRTLNTLLRQAIHQKIALTQRLEEFELARERLRQFTKKNIKGASNKTSSKSTPDKPVTRV